MSLRLPNAQVKKTAQRPAPADSNRRCWVIFFLIAAAGVTAYCNTFTVPFLFDDIDSIVRNPHVRSIVPNFFIPNPGITVAGRPFLEFTFALNYAMGGLSAPWYHATNLLIHISAALVLFGILRRNFADKKVWGDRFGDSAATLAGLIAILWVVHPLNTESVTYVVQRAESLASFFYLAVIYCLIRIAVEDSASRRVWWELLGCLCVVLGTASKEILVTVPFVALLYDRTFLAGSFKRALQSRRRFYLLLTPTWIIAAVMVLVHARGTSVGADQGISPWDYLLTQSSVVAHYLRLVVLPIGLVFDEQSWPIAHHISDINFGWVTIALLIFSLIALFKKPLLGFSLAAFFLILAPTSSVIPIVSEIAAEHRMYLARPTAGDAGCGVLFHAAKRDVRARAHRDCRLYRPDDRANQVYATDEGIWADTIAKRPDDARANFNLGIVEATKKDLPAAIPEFYTALNCSRITILLCAGWGRR